MLFEKLFNRKTDNKHYVGAAIIKDNKILLLQDKNGEWNIPMTPVIHDDAAISLKKYLHNQLGINIEKCDSIEMSTCVYVDKVRKILNIYNISEYHYSISNIKLYDIIKFVGIDELINYDNISDDVTTYMMFEYA